MKKLLILAALYAIIHTMVYVYSLNECESFLNLKEKQRCYFDICDENVYECIVHPSISSFITSPPAVMVRSINGYDPPYAI